MYDLLRQALKELTGPGGAFEIAEEEVRGQRIRVYAKAPPSLRHLWLASAAHGDADYLVYRDERWSYARAHEEVAHIAAWLSRQGVGPGDRVGIAMRNYPEWMLAYWATLCVGASAVGMNAWWVSAELRFALEDSTPKVLICDAERLERVLPERQAFPNTLLVGVRCDALPADVTPWETLIAEPGGLPQVEPDPDDDACIFYTSGTTGRPKGARLTHRGCVANLMSMGFWEAARGRVAAQRLQGPPPAAAKPLQRCALITTPLFHVTANNCIAQSMTVTGGKLVHMYKWDAGEALRLVEKERVTSLGSVPVMCREMLTHPDFAAVDTSSLQALGGGGAPMQPDLVGKIDAAAEQLSPITGYGLTETSGIISSNGGEFLIDKPASAGLVMPVYEAKCVDEAGRDVGRDALGELWVRGAQVFRGYLNRPEATDAALCDGWFRTGDIARLDADGFVFLVDRIKDMVLRGGENIYCSEVEAAIFEHDAVRECAAFAVPDERLGEEVGAALVLYGKGSLDAETLRKHLAERIAAHKIPRYLWFRDELLPRNASGKFLKRELAEHYASHLGDAS